MPSGRAATISRTPVRRLGARRSHSDVASGRTVCCTASRMELSSTSSAKSCPSSAASSPRSHYQPQSASAKKQKESPHTSRFPYSATHSRACSSLSIFARSSRIFSSCTCFSAKTAHCWKVALNVKVWGS